MEKEERIDLLAEVAGTPTQPIPMTEEQAYYLHTMIDPELNRLIQNLDMEKENIRKSKPTYNDWND